ncbi:MAG: SRPBCC domain-containing protein [Sideroxydans sp.]|nr:SRPBCC domain-containing protein [Sideroxydans sp.]
MSAHSQSQSYTTVFTVDQTPQQVFAAINNVRGWWSENIQGSTDKLGEEFHYRFQELHRCTMKITELVPDKKVVWRVLENYFNFTQDKTEWTGTEIIFDIISKGNKTELSFTHVGLVPEYECYNVCSEGWGFYINRSLHDLITSGKGQPNANEPITESEKALHGQSYTTVFSVEQTPQQVFDAINNVRGWWTGDIVGNTSQLGDEFTYRYKDFHYSKHKITELTPDKKVVWLVTESSLNFVKDKNEWNGTKITFEIAKKGGKTEVSFTHSGLVPDIECYDACSDAWGGYINGSLRDLIVTGKGWPDQQR